MSNTDTANKDLEKKFAELIGPTDPKVDLDAREKLISARVGLLLNAPFFGNMATRLQLTNADDWLTTAATDGRKFYYNSRFINMLRTKELEFLFGHEVLHCCYDHFGRRGSRDPQLWNIADDYCVNADLKKHNVGEMITTVPALYERKYKGMSAEEVYDDLYENAEKIDMQQLMDQVFDEHLDGDGDDGQGSGQGGNDQSGEGKSGPDALTEEEKKQIRDEIKEAMLTAAEAAGAGNVPGNVKKMIKDLTEPQMDWRELLDMTLTSAIKDDYSFMRPSRKSWHMDAIMPGQTPGEEVDIAVAVDTSGSISQTMLMDFLSEVQGCMESFTAYKIHLFCFDTNYHNPMDFTSDDISDITDYELGGFGGTDFKAIFEHLKEDDIVPERLVVFTDGYPWDTWGDPDYCDTLWIIHGNKTIEAPFGVTSYYEELADKKAA